MDLLSQMLTDLVAWCWRWTTWLAPTIRTCSCSEWWPRISNRRPGFGRGASGRGTHGAGGGTRFGPSPCWLFRPVECSTSNCSKCCFPDRQSCGPTREIDQFKIKSIPSLKSSIIWSDFFQFETERLQMGPQSAKLKLLATIADFRFGSYLQFTIASCSVAILFAFPFEFLTDNPRSLKAILIDWKTFAFIISFSLISQDEKTNFHFGSEKANRKLIGPRPPYLLASFIFAFCRFCK